MTCKARKGKATQKKWTHLWDRPTVAKRKSIYLKCENLNKNYSKVFNIKLYIILSQNFKVNLAFKHA